MVSSPSEPRDTPLTMSEGQAHSLVALVRSAWRATRNVSHHAHDSEESALPSVFDGVTPISQRRGATQSMGRKSAKELLSLAFLSHILSYRF
jgi:hypothetical protein